MQGIVGDGLSHRGSLTAGGHSSAIMIKLQGLSGVVMAHLTENEEPLYTEDYLRSLNWQNIEINQELVPIDHERHLATSPLARQEAGIANSNIERGNIFYSQSNPSNHTRLDKIMVAPLSIKMWTV